MEIISSGTLFNLIILFIGNTKIFKNQAKKSSFFFKMRSYMTDTSGHEI